MNKKELLELLAPYSDDTRVLISGYEGGLKDVEKNNIFIANVSLFYHGPLENYYGPHEIRDREEFEFDRNWLEKDCKREECIVISRNPRSYDGFEGNPSSKDSCAESTPEQGASTESFIYPIHDAEEGAEEGED